MDPRFQRFPYFGQPALRTPITGGVAAPVAIFGGGVAAPIAVFGGGVAPPDPA